VLRRTGAGGAGHRRRNSLNAGEALVRIAVCGGVYSNPYALRAFIADAPARGAQRLYCLGDLGGYGAEPETVWPLLAAGGVECIAGNYDVAIAQGSPDCGCGYRDPRDQEYAQIMYDYTVRHTSRKFAAWMAGLPTERRESLGGCNVHFVHGSPTGISDFWWESQPPHAHAARVAQSGADVIFCTHSGLPWILQINGALAVNVGVLGRPPNDGGLEVRYALADLSAGAATAQIIRLPYDWRAQAGSMRRAGLPEAFTRTNETGWWATCLEVLPTQERSLGRYHIYDSSVGALLEAAGLPRSAWPDPDPVVPVRPLPGSPLLPDRIWLTDPALQTTDVMTDAAAAGIADVRLLGVSPLPDIRYIGGRADLPLPELTLTRKGWQWHPALQDTAPFLAAGQDHAANRLAAGSAKAAQQTAVRLLLEQFQECGALTPPRYCVT
jgi:hypothetical protein